MAIARVAGQFDAGSEVEAFQVRRVTVPDRRIGDKSGKAKVGKDSVVEVDGLEEGVAYILVGESGGQRREVRVTGKPAPPKPKRARSSTTRKRAPRKARSRERLASPSLTDRGIPRDKTTDGKRASVRALQDPDAKPGAGTSRREAKQSGTAVPAGSAATDTPKTAKLTK